MEGPPPESHKNPQQPGKPDKGPGNDYHARPAIEDLKFIVRETLSAGARIVQHIDRILAKLNS